MSIFWQKLRVVLKRDLLVALRLRGGIATVISLLFEVGGLYYLARSVGAGYHPEGVDYFAFATVGTAFVTFLMAGLGSFVYVTQEFQANGTLEVLLNTGTSPAGVITFNSVPSLFRYGFGLSVTFLAAYALLSGSSPNFNLLSATLIFILSLALVSILGLIAAAAEIVFRRGRAILWLSGSAVWLLSGTMYPVNALPSVLQKISMLIPITYAITSFRAAVLKGASLSELRSDILVLVLLVAVLGPASILILNASVRLARRRGLLSLF